MAARETLENTRVVIADQPTTKEGADVRLGLDKLTAAMFSPLIGELFQLNTGTGRVVDVELTTVTSLNTASSAPSSLAKREPFSLIFRLPDKSYLPQRIYRLTHSKVGVLDVFLVPIGPDAKGMQLEAIFN